MFVLMRVAGGIVPIIIVEVVFWLVEFIVLLETELVWVYNPIMVWYVR